MILPLVQGYKWIWNHVANFRTLSDSTKFRFIQIHADSSLLESFGQGSKSTKFAASKRQSHWHCFRSIASWRAHFKETSFSRFSSTLYPSEKNMEKRDSILISRSLQAYWSLEKDCPHDKTIYHLYHLRISHTLAITFEPGLALQDFLPGQSL